MKICNRVINAIIFDLDGTLLDSTGIWGEIDVAFFAKRNMEVPKDYGKEIAHIGLKEASILTANKYCIGEKAEDILKEWQLSTKKQYEEIIPLKDNVMEMLKLLKQKNVKMAVATANNKMLYEPCLKRLGIYDYFDVIVDVDKVGSGKNSVEIYDYVANALNVKRENIAVFEDIHIGLKTAYENGYFSIAVYDTNSKDEQLKKKYSHIYINNFDEIIKKMD